MTSILLWTGIIFIVLGWIALAWQASKRMALKDELGKFPGKKDVMKLHRNYCILTIFAGIVLILLALSC